MTSLSDLRPLSKPRLMDLVKQAGVDVRDWEFSELGASNPKYCYEWSFVQARELVVVTLWFPHLEEIGGAIRGHPTPLARLLHLSSIQIVRAKKFNEALKIGHQDKLPIRVVISDGKMRDLKKVEATSSSVRKRMLDPVPWWVNSYDQNTGQYILVRGQKPRKTIDQFDILEQTRRREVIQQVPVRSSTVRQHVLERSGGLCEWCKLPGFEIETGDLYLETHHVIPLSENGPDLESNVVALCPRHHREAHHGKYRTEMRRLLTELLCAPRQP